ncbi:MAG: protein kinase [Gemmatimonadaceae bacterium]
MAADLREQLQNTLSGSYTLERELGGGGMSRVFVATEMALGRKVVIKVLPSDLSEGVSVERFKREIQLAAQLTHPHIVPVHAAGETDGIPYYTMPLVDGHSLRTRLVKSGALSITETIGILRDVAKALSYAHEHGVVHRDIKPDNVLITGGSAVVTDFGIAKAIAAARTGPSGSTLTQIGSALGTPAYMAPEQAAADPGTNYRADIYAFGVMAYEMLAGQPPFHGRTPQKLLAAQMSEMPQPILAVRLDTPPLLAELVMRCLEKDADRRPQSATDLLKVLETVTSGGGHPAMPEILLGGRPRLGRALALWASAFVVVAIVARAAIIAIGLPAWAFTGAIVVMALGLPVILFTYFVHHGAHQALTMGALTPGGSVAQRSTLTRLAVKASPWVNWRRTTMGGVAALGMFVLLVVGYMISRATGIGPAASLMASGVLGAREKVLIADFRGPSSDTSLGPVVTEAFRSDLAQSRNVDVVQPTVVREVLRRMQRSANTGVDYALAREIAAREGIKAIVDGEVLSLGGSYVLSAKLISAQSGEVLATSRATAKDASEIIGAIDRLSRSVRTKIGESLKSINAAPPLEQVTTPSLEALKKYVQGVRVFSEALDFERGVALLEEAVALDSGFAMAYRKLAIEYSNRGGMAAKRVAAIEKAYAHRDRLSEPERYLTIAAYFQSGPEPDLAKSMSAYEALLELQPNNTTALNNLGLDYNNLRRFDRAELLTARAVAASPTAVVYFNNLLRAQIGLGKEAEALRTIEQYENAIPGNRFSPGWRANMLFRAEKYDSADAIMQAFRNSRGSEPAVRRNLIIWMGGFALLRGKVAEARRWSREGRQIDEAQGILAAPLLAAADEAIDQSRYFGNKRAASAILDSALIRHAFERIPPIDRPHESLAAAYAEAGRPDRAREMLARFDETRKTVAQANDEYVRLRILGHIASSEQRYEEAVRYYREADQVGCTVCLLPTIARNYDLAGNTDSALAVFTRYVEQKNESLRLGIDTRNLPAVHQRLGELWEQKGDKQRAMGHYLKFVELWKNADPALQPKVSEARRRIARLKDVEGR